MTDAQSQMITQEKKVLRWFAKLLTCEYLERTQHYREFFYSVIWVPVGL